MTPPAAFERNRAWTFVVFEPSHRDGCLALFDLNCPEYFAPNERTDYETFLDTKPADYRVALRDHRVVAAFGLLPSSRSGHRRLTWILVAPDAQGTGLGRGMMHEARAEAAKSEVRVIDIAASHKSAPFFATFGARAIDETLDGWGPGMHRVDMEWRMSDVLFTGRGGTLVLPQLLLVDRHDGGHLVVNPPREVWERSELTRDELSDWACLVAAAGRAMIDSLPQLTDGCVNYWEAGNWSLHDEAAPHGSKSAPEHRRVHLHLLGRSRSAADAAWKWGEAPQFPRFANRLPWAQRCRPLTARECDTVVERTRHLLVTRYGGWAPGISLP
jgi:GNAT superfamily N-acetyltransferase/diadenosine tetraphosphate (Ap4A) HIT family hydrolase